MKKLLVGLTLIASWSVMMIGCTKDKSTDPYVDSGVDTSMVDTSNDAVALCDTLVVDFDTDLLSLFSATCATSFCHDATTATNGYVFDSYTNVKSAFMTGPVLAAINHEAGTTAMPLGGSKLSSGDLDKIGCWVEGGMIE